MAVGVDIGNTSVKVVWTRKNGKQFQLLSAGAATTPIRGMKSDSDQDMAQLATSIKKLFADANIKVKDVVMGIPESDVITKIIYMPKLSDKELASAIEWEAEQYIPTPIDETNISYEVLERPKDDAAKMKILLVATSKRLVEKYVKVAELAGVNVIAIETHMFALWRSLAVENKDTTMIVNLGAASTDMGIISGGNIVFTRSIQTGGDAFTRAISVGLSMDIVQAEAYKKTYGIDAKQLEGKVANSIRPIFDVLASEIMKSIEFYRSQSPNETIRSIVLSGGGAGMPELVSNLVSKLGVEVVIGDPFSRLAKDTKLANALTGYSPLYGVAVGLSLREE